MTFADMDCGIAQPHRHTGEIVEGYHIEYWCPSITAWVTDRSKTSYGIRCMCAEPHMKARIQHVMTEIIEIIPEAYPDQEDGESFEEWLKRTLKEHYFYCLFHGEEAYQRWAGNHERITEERDSADAGNPPSGPDVRGIEVQQKDHEAQQMGDDQSS